MKSKIVITILVFAAMIVSVYLVLNKDNESIKRQYFILDINGLEHKVNLMPVPVVQKAGRKYVDKKLHYLFELGEEADTVIYIPSHIRAIEDGSVFVEDAVTRSVNKFSPDGKFIQKYGKYGKGPGEFTRPKYFEVDNAGRVFMLDYGKITVFDNNEIFEYPINYADFFKPIDADDLILFNNLFGNISLIEKYNLRTKEKVAFEEIYEPDTKLPGMKNFGTLLFGTPLYTSNKLIYVPYYFNLIYIFENEKVKRVATTIDQESHPKLLIKSEGNYEFTYDKYLTDFQINESSFLINDFLYILSLPARKETKKFVFDVYEINSCTYIHSLRFDYSESFISIYLTKNRFFLVNGDYKIKVFSY